MAWAATPAPATATHAAAVASGLRGTHCLARTMSPASACSHMRIGGNKGGGGGGDMPDPAARAVVAAAAPAAPPHSPGNWTAAPPRPSAPGPTGAGVAHTVSRAAHALMPGIAAQRAARVAAGAGQAAPGTGAAPGQAAHSLIPCDPHAAPMVVARDAAVGAAGKGPGLEQAGDRGDGRGGQARR